jgi:hypothetical protein
MTCQELRLALDRRLFNLVQQRESWDRAATSKGGLCACVQGVFDNLTGLLLSALSAKGDGRVVTMSSDIAAPGQIDFDDLQAERHYGLVKTYAQSELADLVFAIELDRRARAAGRPR